MSKSFAARQRPGLLWLAAAFMPIPVAILLWTIVITRPHAGLAGQATDLALMLPFTASMAFAVHKAAQDRQVRRGMTGT